MAIFVLPSVCAEDTAKPQLFDLVLVSSGDVVHSAKAVHDVSGMSLKDSKALVESPPKTVLMSVTKEMAAESKKHVEASGCKLEIRPALAGTAVRKFDVVILKVDPAKREAVVKLVADMTKAAGAADDKAILSNLTPGEAELKRATLEAAGATVEWVSNGGVETGGFSVFLTKVEPRSKIATIATVREHSGLPLSNATKLVETLPHAVKIKITKDEAEKIKAALEAHKAAAEMREFGK